MGSIGMGLLRDRLKLGTLRIERGSYRLNQVLPRLQAVLGRPKPLPTRISALRNRLHPVLLRQRLASSQRRGDVFVAVS